MPVRRYYTLVASLPALKHFERAERLPINAVRLEQRLLNLHADDATELEAARRLVEWRRHPVERSPEQVAELYSKTMTAISNPRLHAFVNFRMNERTAVAALRMRHRGRSAKPGEVWGVGPRVRWIESHWDAPDFRLGGLFPWLGEARTMIEADDAKGLERLLMDLMWRRLGRMADEHPFAFEQVVAFVFKWEILARWLSYAPEPATERFQELITETIGDQQLFA